MEEQGSRLERGRTRDGRTITWQRHGSGPLLVCHPGGPGFSGVYFETLGGLAAERTLVLVNPAGTASSDPWTEHAYSLDVRADDLDDVRAALGAEHIDLLGHSAGGFVAIRYATGRPERVRRLVLTDTFAHFDAIRAAREAFFARKEADPAFADVVAATRERMSRDDLTPEETAELGARSFPIYFKRLTPEVFAFVDRLFTSDRAFDLRTLKSFNGQVASFDLRPELASIRAPTLVVYGSDELERAGERELAAGIPGARVAIVEDAGHFPWVEQPEAFRRAVEAFLSE